MATIGTINLAKGDIYTTAHKLSENRSEDGYGILTGCDVHQKATPAMGVTIDAGTVMYNGAYLVVAGGDIAIDASSASYPRFDIVYINSSGSAVVAKGTAASILPSLETAFKKMTTPYPNPSIPTGVILARIYVAAGVTTILNAAIDDIAMNITQVPIGVLTTRGDIPYRGANMWERLAKGTSNQVLTQGANDPTWSTRYYSMQFPFGDGAAVLLANAKILLEVPITGKIITARCFSSDNTSGSITFGLWQDQYADGIPTSGDSIATFSISSSTKNQYTGLSYVVTSGDLLVVNINSVTSLKAATLSLTVEVT